MFPARSAARNQSSIGRSFTNASGGMVARHSVLFRCGPAPSASTRIARDETIPAALQKRVTSLAPPLGHVCVYTSSARRLITRRSGMRQPS
jgi:hypothetical protein